MREKRLTAVPGTRTSAIQYEIDRPDTKRPEELPFSQCFRQGNRKYSVSPIYQPRVDTKK